MMLAGKILASRQDARSEPRPSSIADLSALWDVVGEGDDNAYPEVESDDALATCTVEMYQRNSVAVTRSHSEGVYHGFSRLQDPSIKKEPEDILKSILNLAFPALGAVLSDPLMSLIDTGCVGQTGSIQLAALGPNTSIFNFVFQAFTFLGTTTCNLLARIGTKEMTKEEAEQKKLEASRLLSHALFLAVVSGLAVFLALELLAPQLLGIMGTKEEYLAPAISYLRVRALSAPAVLTLIVGQGACMGRQDAKTPFRINFTAAFCNLIGDLIFTLWAGWGVAGAALATFVAQCIAVSLLIKFLKGSPKTIDDVVDEEHESLVSTVPPSASPAVIPLVVGWYGLPSQDALEPFIAMAGPLILRSALGMTFYTMMAKVAAESGTLEIAAHQVAMQTFWTLSYFPEALSVAAQSLIAGDIRQDPRRMGALARTLVTLAVGSGLALALCVGIIHTLCSSWLSSDVRVRQLMLGVTPQSMVSIVLSATVQAIEGVAIGSGDIKYLPRMQFINLAGVLSALTLTQRLGWGLHGVWWSLVLYFATRLIYHSCHISAQWKDHALGAAAFGAVRRR